MATFSFIHAADLHLDSPFQGLSAQDPAIADALRAATFDAYRNLIRLCIEEKVQFLLIAGDVYDGTDRSLRAQLRFRDGLATLAAQGIQSFLVHGNHDPLDGWSSSLEWPAGVHVFGGERVASVPWGADGTPLACISGISYPKRSERRNLARLFRTEPPDLFQIGLLHCNCGGNPHHEAYAPCGLDDLTRPAFHYWALGHVHKPLILHRDPWIAYAGNAQGRHIREQGACGCWLVKVRDGRPLEPAFRPLDAVRWATAEVEIQGVESMDALDRAIADKLDALRAGSDGRPLICRLALTGRGPLYRELSRNQAAEELLVRARETGVAADPFVWVQSLEPDCRPELDLERRSQSRDLLGQVLTLARELREGEDLQEELAPVLAGLFEDGRARRALSALTPEELERLLADAELLCADLLEPDE